MPSDETDTFNIELAGVQPAWKSQVICPNLRLRPRQFEYDPNVENRLVFGTVGGEVVVCNPENSEVVKRISAGVAKNHNDAILGLCWLRKRKDFFISGSSAGILSLCNINNNQDQTLTDTDHSNEEVSIFSKNENIVQHYQKFKELTSVHIDCEDHHLLTCGYSNSIRLDDLETGKVVQNFDDIHKDHINISRFGNRSPHIFATSSFDKTAKLWDIRCKKKPIHTLRSSTGYVMLSFSPDDVNILTSAVDNEVVQYTALDGKKQIVYPIPRKKLSMNYTRAYYSCSGRFMLCGSSEEQMIRLHCAYTGTHLQSAELYPGRKHNSIYIQSLRGDTFHDTKLSVLVNYRDEAYPLEIVHMDMLSHSRNDNDQTSSINSHAPSSSSLSSPSSSLSSSNLNDAERRNQEEVSLANETKQSAWFAVGRPTSDLMGRLREALQCSENTDVVLRCRVDPKFINTSLPDSSASSNYHTSHQDIHAHACILACRSRILKNELLRIQQLNLSSSSSSQVIEEENLIDQMSHQQKQRTDKDDSEMLVEIPLKYEVLQVVLEYIYCDRLTLYCDRMSKNSTSNQWLQQDEPSDRDGSINLMSDNGDQEEGDDADNEVRDVPELHTSPKEVRTGQCPHVATVLKELTDVLIAASRLELDHLISLCLSRCQRIVAPSNVVAIAHLANFIRDDLAVSPLFTNLSSSSLSPKSKHREDIRSVAFDLVQYCIHYLVIHLEVSIVAIRSQQARNETEAVLQSMSSIHSLGTSSSSSTSSNNKNHEVHDDSVVNSKRDSEADNQRSGFSSLSHGDFITSLYPGGWLRQEIDAIRENRKLKGNIEPILTRKQPKKTKQGHQNGTEGAAEDNEDVEEEEEEDDDDDYENDMLMGDPNMDTGIIHSHLVPQCYGHTCTAVMFPTPHNDQSNTLSSNRINDGSGGGGRSGGDISSWRSGDQEEEDLEREGLVDKSSSNHKIRCLDRWDNGGGSMLVLGGVTKMQVLGIHDLMFFSFQDGIWRKATSTGTVPRSQVYHSAVALETVYNPISAFNEAKQEQEQEEQYDELDNTMIVKGEKALNQISSRYVIVFGGSTQTKSTMVSGDEIFVLDCVHLHWWVPHSLNFKQPSIHRHHSAPIKPCQRTRHTMVGMYPLSKNNNNNQSTNYSEDQVLGTMVLFGGYNDMSQVVLNDVWFLDIFPCNHTLQQEEEQEDTDEQADQDENADAESKSKKSVNAQSVHVGMNHPSSKKQVKHQEDYFTFQWRQEEPQGNAPQPRLSHSSCAIHPLPLSSSSDGVLCNTSSYMVVFGGLGTNAIFGDLHLLRVDKPCGQNEKGGGINRGTRWENLSQIHGMGPSPRYDSQMSVIPCNQYYTRGFPTTSSSSTTTNVTQTHGALIACFGGTYHSMYSELYLLDVDLSNPDTPKLTWSTPAIAANQMGSPQTHQPFLPSFTSSLPNFIQSKLSSFTRKNKTTTTATTTRDEQQSITENDRSKDDENESRLTFKKPEGRMSMDLCVDPNSGSLLMFGGTNIKRGVPSEDQPPPLNNSVYILHQPNFKFNKNNASSSSSSSYSDVDQILTKIPNQVSDEQYKEKHVSWSWSSLSTEVYEAGPEIAMHWTPSSFISDLASLVDSSLFHDVTFEFDQSDYDDEDDQNNVGNVEVPPGGGNAMKRVSNHGHRLVAHRVLLGRKGDPLRAMLECGGMIEAQQGIVKLKDVGKSTFMALIAFLYTDSFLLPITPQTEHEEGQEPGQFYDLEKKKQFEDPLTLMVYDPMCAQFDIDPNEIMTLLLWANSYTLRRLVKLCEGMLSRLVHPKDNAAILLSFSNMMMNELSYLYLSIQTICYRNENLWSQFINSDDYNDLDNEMKTKINHERLHLKHLYMGGVINHINQSEVLLEQETTVEEGDDEPDDEDDEPSTASS